MSTTLATLDPRALAVADLPPEWEHIPRKLLKRLHGRTVFTRDEMARVDRIAQARWFLIQNEYAFVDPQTKRREAYLTFRGVERPWNGLDEVIGIFEEVDPLWETSDGAEVVVDETLSGYRLGSLVPISARDALRYWMKIRAKDPRSAEPYMRLLIEQLQGGRRG